MKREDFKFLKSRLFTTLDKRGLVLKVLNCISKINFKTLGKENKLKMELFENHMTKCPEIPRKRRLRITRKALRLLVLLLCKQFSFCFSLVMRAIGWANVADSDLIFRGVNFCY